LTKKLDIIYNFIIPLGGAPSDYGAFGRRKGGDPMVTYEGLFQYTLVLLTVLIAAAAWKGRKK
jgi:hypothetical protein